MNYLSVENISKRFGDRLLFEDVTFGMDKGDKVAIVAKNGSGKSTMLNILCGKDTPDDGRVVFRNDISLGYLEQEDVFKNGRSILENALDAKDKYHKAILDYSKALRTGEGLEKAMEVMNELNAWDADVAVKEALTALGLENYDEHVDHLSGGEKKRLALAKLLALEPDFMILDEPTNHLDMAMIEWLEQRLGRSNSTILMVTHDRYFLEVVCSHILELDRKTVFRYEGNFSTYLEKKAERDAIEQATLSKAKNLYRRELEWMRRMPKARGTKSKARQGAFYDTEKVVKSATTDAELELLIKPERLGTKTIELHNVGLELAGKPLFEKFNYNFKRNERIGIIGPNGSGKTSLLRTILGDLDPTKGKVVIGETVRIGYYSQKGLQFKNDKRVIEVIKDIAEVIPAEKGRKLSAAQMLERFLFPKETHYQYVHTLSGGEKKRLYLLTVLMSNPNILILDEPTNDLDIYAMAALEEYLISFPGSVVVVSHDRYFLDKVVEHMFVFERGTDILDFPGNYSQYLAKPKAKKTQKVEAKSDEDSKDYRNREKKLSYKEKLEFETLSKDIEKLESKQREMNQIAAEGSFEDAEQFFKELSEIGEEIDEKTMRWMELAEMQA